MMERIVDDEVMVVCLASACRHNDKEGACRAEDGIIQITTGPDGRPSCEEYEPDPRWIEEISPLKV